MKKFILSLSLFLLSLTAFAVDASAKDMSRRFGVGVDSTISDYAGDGRGVSVIYDINKYFAIQLIFGMDVTTAEVENDYGDKFDSSITNWSVSLRGIIPVIFTTDVNLAAVVGFTACGTSSDGFEPASYTNVNDMKYKDGYNFSIDVGVRPEWFVNDHFSIHTQIGIGINIITNSSTTASAGLASDGTVFRSTKASGASVSFFNNADFLGEAGFTFWF